MPLSFKSLYPRRLLFDTYYSRESIGIPTLQTWASLQFKAPGYQSQHSSLPAVCGPTLPRTRWFYRWRRDSFIRLPCAGRDRVTRPSQLCVGGWYRYLMASPESPTSLYPHPLGLTCLCSLLTQVSVPFLSLICR